MKFEEFQEHLHPFVNYRKNYTVLPDHIIQSYDMLRGIAAIHLLYHKTIFITFKIFSMNNHNIDDGNMIFFTFLLTTTSGIANDLFQGLDSGFMKI